MGKIKLVLPVILLISYNLNVYAQFLTAGNDQGNLRWEQIRGLGYRLIYPEYDRLRAIRIAYQASNVLPVLSRTSGKASRPVPMVLHSGSVVSGGKTVFAPRQIELYPRQPLCGISQDFSNLLLINQFRYISQMEILNTGFTRTAYSILGDQAIAVVKGLQVPKWFSEGDALLAETLLSSSGRGRSPSFSGPLRSQVLSGRAYSWDKILFGSYRDFVPQPHIYGYYLVAYARMLSSPEIWEESLRDIGRNPFQIAGLGRIFRERTGLTKTLLYNSAIDWLRDYWNGTSGNQGQVKGLKRLVEDARGYCDYHNPKGGREQGWISLRDDMAGIPAFIKTDSSGKSKTLFHPGNIEGSSFSFKNERIAWSGMTPDPRWQNRSWSDLYIHDLKDRKTRKISRHGRLFNPVLNPDGTKIACIEETETGVSGMVIVDLATGRNSPAITAGYGQYFSCLAWGIGDKEIWAIKTGPKGKSLVRLDLANMVPEPFMEFGYREINHILYLDPWVYLTGPFGSATAVYRIHRTSLEIELAIETRTGIAGLDGDENDLLFSIYTPDGLRPARIPLSEITGKPVDSIQGFREPVTGSIARAENEKPINFTQSGVDITWSPYKKASHLLHFHSWTPLFLDPQSYQVSPGLMLVSQNELAGMIVWGGYQYHKQNGSHNLTGAVQYSGRYPVFDLSITQSLGRFHRESETESYHIPAGREFQGSISVPLDFSSGAWTRKLVPLVYFKLFRPHYNGVVHSEDTTFYLPGMDIRFELLRQKSTRDLFPRWGLVARIRADRSYWKSSSGNFCQGQLSLFLPGILSNHSTRITSSISRINRPEHPSDPLADLPRGFAGQILPEPFCIRMDYSFPLLYPDFNLSWLLYVKRIKGNVFADQVWSLSGDQKLASTGLDLTADYHLFRSGVLLESGCRILWFPQTGKSGLEFLFGFKLN